MSKEARDWAIALPVLRGNEKAALMRLADFADEDDMTYRSQARLAADLGCSVETVRNVLLRLRERGLIEPVEQGGGRGRATRFWLRLDRTIEAAPKPPRSAAREIRNPQDFGTKPPRFSSETPKISPAEQKEQRKEQRGEKKAHAREPRAADNVVRFPAVQVSPTSVDPPSLFGSEAATPGRTKRKPTEDPDFDVFWLAYPKPKAKPRAAKAFSRHVKAGVTLAVILAALERAKVEDHRFRGDPQFTPFPEAWLNGEPWNDGAARPAAPSRQQGSNAAKPRNRFAWMEGALGITRGETVEEAEPTFVQSHEVDVA